MRRLGRLIIILMAGFISISTFAGVRVEDVQVVDDSERGETIFRVKFNHGLRSVPSPEFTRNIIQFSLNGIQAWPAREAFPQTSSQKNTFEKAIAYQFNPGTARFRIMLNEDAEKFNDKTKVSVVGDTLEIRVWNRGPKKTGANTAVAKKSDSIQVKQSATTRSPVEQEIINEVMKSNQQGKKPNFKKEVKENTKKAEKKDKEFIGIKSFGQTFLALFGVLSLILLLAFGTKRVMKKGKFKHLLPGAKEKFIELVENHPIAQKKSMAVVRIGGEYFVVGMTPENINLITKLDRSPEIESQYERKKFGEAFEKEVTNEKPAEQKLKEPFTPPAAAVSKSYETFTNDDLNDQANLTKEIGDDYQVSVKKRITERLKDLRPL